MNTERLQKSDPRKHREIIKQIIQRSEACYSGGQPANAKVDDSPAFKSLQEYVYSLSDDQLDAVTCAYALIHDYVPPKIADSEAEDDDEEDEDDAQPFKSVQEWTDWAIKDYMDTADLPDGNIEWLLHNIMLAKFLRKAMNYLFA